MNQLQQTVQGQMTKHINWFIDLIYINWSLGNVAPGRSCLNHYRKENFACWLKNPSCQNPAWLAGLTLPGEGACKLVCASTLERSRSALIPSESVRARRKREWETRGPEVIIVRVRCEFVEEWEEQIRSKPSESWEDFRKDCQNNHHKAELIQCHESVLV